MKVTIEIAMYSKYKYEMDKDSGILVLDRPLNQSIPSNYGFFNNTLAEDNDPLDCFIITQAPLLNGSQCKVYIIGAFVCTDQEIPDHKLICTLQGELTMSQSRELDDIRCYLETYKKGFKVLEWVDKDKAQELFENSSKVYKDQADKKLNELTKINEFMRIKIKE